MPLPLQLPTPAEMLVIVLIFGILFGIPIGVLYVLRQRKRRVTALQERVDELESRLDDDPND